MSNDECLYSVEPDDHGEGFNVRKATGPNFLWFAAGQYAHKLDHHRIWKLHKILGDWLKERNMDTHADPQEKDQSARDRMTVMMRDELEDMRLTLQRAVSDRTELRERIAAVRMAFIAFKETESHRQYPVDWDGLAKLLDIDLS